MLYLFTNVYLFGGKAPNVGREWTISKYLKTLINKTVFTQGLVQNLKCVKSLIFDHVFHSKYIKVDFKHANTDKQRMENPLGRHDI